MIGISPTGNDSPETPVSGGTAGGGTLLFCPVLHHFMAEGSGEQEARSIVAFRKQKDDFFRESAESPLAHDHRMKFSGLSYFPYDPQYRLETTLQRNLDPSKIVLATSKGIPREMLEFGHFEFPIEGGLFRLTAYSSLEHGHEGDSLFVPFKDMTNGVESYGAGRYLDLEFQSDDRYVTDFNLAYNPWCAYSDAFVCPFPPPANTLKVRIPAGEKEFSYG